MRISILGRKKMLSGPETPGISLDTLDFEHSGNNSSYKPGYSGHWNTPGETPGIDPETPDLGVRILRAGVRILWVFGYFWVDKSNWGRSLVVVLGRGLIVIIKSYLHQLISYACV